MIEVSARDLCDPGLSNGHRVAWRPGAEPSLVPCAGHIDPAVCWFRPSSVVEQDGQVLIVGADVSLRFMVPPDQPVVLRRRWLS